MRTVLLLCLCLASALGVAATDGTVESSALPPFLTRSDDTLVSYRGIRRLEAANTRFGHRGWLEASVSLGPDGFAFSVLQEGGSRYIRDNVLKKALAGEVDAIRRGEGRRSGLSPDNYAFGPAEPVGAGVLAFPLRPRRHDGLLVEGHLTVSSVDGDLLSVEGTLVKPPSFWTRRVRVVRRYARVMGIRVPMSTESWSDVRIAGPSTLTMTTRYVEINGRSVETP